MDIPSNIHLSALPPDKKSYFIDIAQNVSYLIMTMQAYFVNASPL